jgi:type III restriction enzyme
MATKMETKQFQYEIQRYQEDCVSNIVSLFESLRQTVSIRERTKVNFEDTKDYFKSFYANEKEKEIETFVYEGGNISAVRKFIGTSHLSVLVMTPSSFSHKDNILNRPSEKDINTPELFVNNQEPPKSYLECLKRLNPIVIMDEPHLFEGNAFKTYFDGFENYFLRFGATYPKTLPFLLMLPNSLK